MTSQDSIAQTWRPLGRVANAPGREWGATHASNPTPLLLGDGLVRVFFSTRDAENRSSTASVDLSLEGEAVRVAGPIRGPLLSPGARGAFDADGVTVASLVRHEGRLYAYYLGWTVLKHVPFTNFIGLAIGDEEGTAFERASIVPVVGRSPQNPFTIGYPWVCPLDDGRWRMWYGTHLSWGPTGLQMDHVLKTAESDDLLAWTPQDRVCVDLARQTDPAEFAVSRPCVLREQDGAWSMWYARRRPGYALGFARSEDGEAWTRRDEDVRFAGVPEGWEDRERTYPCVFDHAGRRYMFYNGNGYGREGFGVAVLES